MHRTDWLRISDRTDHQSLKRNTKIPYRKRWTGG